MQVVLQSTPEFKPPDKRVVTVQAPARTFVPEAAMPELNAEHAAALVAFARWEVVFPCGLNPRYGRSLQAATTPGGYWRKLGIHAVKAKGIGGLSFASSPGGFVLVQPQPSQPYGQAELHIRLGSDLRIETVASRPKGLFSLAAEGARREFECHQRLAAHELGFRPLMHGRFAADSGEPERDVFGNATGAVFLEAHPRFRSLIDYQRFLVFAGTGQFLEPAAHHVAGGEGAFLRLIQNSIDFSARLAKVKSRALIEAGVAHHSSHAGNFLFDPTTDADGRTLMTDTDSCLLTTELTSTSKGAQLLRDFSTATVRMISDLSLSAYSPGFYSLMEAGQVKPFHSFVDGLFGSYLNPSHVAAASDGLHREYLRFSKAVKKFADGIAPNYGEAVLKGDDPGQHNAAFRWGLLHQSFLQPVLREYYFAVTQGSLPRRGFSLPRMDEDQLVRLIGDGIHKFIADVLSGAGRCADVRL